MNIKRENYFYGIRYFSNYITILRSEVIMEKEIKKVENCMKESSGDGLPLEDFPRY